MEWTGESERQRQTKRVDTSERQDTAPGREAEIMAQAKTKTKEDTGRVPQLRCTGLESAKSVPVRQCPKGLLKDEGLIKEKTELTKGAWGMPRLPEAKKDVTSCEKPRGGANAR